MRASLLIVLLFAAAVAHGRVYYLQNADGGRYADANYAVPEEQSSRDLDLSFSAGDDAEIAAVQPAKKTYTLLVPDNRGFPLAEAAREPGHPIAYKLVGVPTRHAAYDDAVFLPEKSASRLVKLDGKNSKGEVILELRVIANHDAV